MKLITPSPRALGRLLLVGGFGAALATASPAAADVIDPGQEACQGKAEGDACSAAGTSGTCQPGECCKNDYSQGTPPKSVCGPCLLCKQGGGVDQGDAGPSSGGTTTSSDAGGCSAAAAGMPPWTLPGLLLGAGALLWLRRRGPAR